MTYQEKIESELEQAFSEYQAKVETIADRVRQEKLIPYLKNHNYSFLGAWGSWVIWDVESGDVPEKISSLLEMNVKGTSNCLAEFMSQYPENREK